MCCNVLSCKIVSTYRRLHRNRKTTIFNGKIVVFLTLYWFLRAHRLCFIAQELTPVLVAPGDPIQYPAQVFALKADVSQQIYTAAQGALYIVAQLSVFKLRYTGCGQNPRSTDAEGVGQSGNLVADMVQERRVLEGLNIDILGGNKQGEVPLVQITSSSFSAASSPLEWKKLQLTSASSN